MASTSERTIVSFLLQSWVNQPVELEKSARDSTLSSILVFSHVLTNFQRGVSRRKVPVLL